MSYSTSRPSPFDPEMFFTFGAGRRWSFLDVAALEWEQRSEDEYRQKQQEMFEAFMRREGHWLPNEFVLTAERQERWRRF